MGLLDWLTEGIGSDMGGLSAPVSDMSTNGPGTSPVQGPGMDVPPIPPTGGSVLSQTMPNETLPVMPPGAGPTPPTPPTPPSATPPVPPTPPDVPPTPPVPLPQPRPPGANAPPPAPPLPPPPAPPPGPPTNLVPPAPPTNLAPPPPVPQSGSLIGSALGMDANKEKSFWGAIGGGLTAAGNSKGKTKGAAFASGAGGALEGSEKTENTSYDQRVKALQLAVAAQAAGDKAEYNKNYAVYLKGKLANDAKEAGGKKSGAWNKPDSQKFIDAQNAMSKDPDIRASQKLLEQASKTMDQSSPEFQKMQAAHSALIQQKQQMYLTGVGLDPAKIQFNAQNPPGTPQNPHIVNSKEDFDTYVKPGQAYRNPADGKIYIRKPDAGKTPESPTPDATPLQPPGNRPDAMGPGTKDETAAEDEDEATT